MRMAMMGLLAALAVGGVASSATAQVVVVGPPVGWVGPHYYWHGRHWHHRYWGHDRFHHGYWRYR
jgi:hypothetical protein